MFSQYRPIILNAATRIMKRSDHVTSPLLRGRLHWLQVPERERLHYELCLVVFEALNPYGTRIHHELLRPGVQHGRGRRAQAVAAGPAGPAGAGPMLRHIYNKKAQLTQREARDSLGI